MNTQPNSLRLGEAPTYFEWSYGVLSAAHIAVMNGWIAPTDANQTDINKKYVDNMNEVNGQTGPTSHLIESKDGSVSRKYNASPERIAIDLSRILGRMTTSAASVARNEVQQLQLGGATAGKFVVMQGSNITAELDVVGLTAGAIQTAINAKLGALSVTVAANAANYDISFTGNGYDLKNVPQMRAVWVTAPTPSTATIQILTTTTGRAAGVYTTNFRWPTQCVLNPPSWAFIEGFACGASTTTYKGYPGATTDSVALNLNGKGLMEWDTTVKVSGDEIDVPTYVFQTTPATVTYLTGGMVQLWIGPNAGTYAAADAISPLDLRDLKISIGAGVREPPSLGRVAVVEYQYGDNRPDLTIEVTIRGDKSHKLYASAMNAEYGERVALRLVIDPQVNPQRTVEFYMARAIVNATPKPSGAENQLTLTFMPEWNTTNDGPAEWWVETAVSAYGVYV